MSESDFKFELSLSILNHLGRNLYRSFTTVLGEAISNAWDADAKEVHIHIDKRRDVFFIKDDGFGMTKEDFQDKFLKIGYSKRNSGATTTKGGRPIIGRKGIGKLALLSCADSIAVISKVSGGDYTGGTIDNSDLDDAIKDDLKADKYLLGGWNIRDFSRYTINHNHGTIIRFKGIKGGIRSSLEFLKKTMALYFRFSLVDPNFKIYINDTEITLGELNKLAEKTQFLWNINNFQDPYISQHLKNLKQTEAIDMGKGVEGFIASVEKPRNLSIEGMDEKVSIDLFVNGRLREKDVLKNVTIVQVAKNYLYGQIHFNDLDDDEDRFTSSRESIVADDPMYNQFLTDLEKKIRQIVRKWDELRDGVRDDGDPENDRIPEATRKAKELVNKVSKRHFSSKYSEKVVTALQEEAQYNLISYTQCFISENLLRNYIRDNNLVPMSCMKMHDGKDCKNHPKSKKNKNDWCPYCRGVYRRKNYASEKEKAKLSFAIRANGRDILGYLDYEELAEIIKSGADRKALEYRVIRAEGKGYRLCRNVVMHTSLLTEEAKTRLTSILDNIAAAIDDFVAKIKPKSK